jgi:hypothetical protein
VHLTRVPSTRVSPVAAICVGPPLGPPWTITSAPFVNPLPVTSTLSVAPATADDGETAVMKVASGSLTLKASFMPNR